MFLVTLQSFKRQRDLTLPTVAEVLQAYAAAGRTFFPSVGVACPAELE
jgi:hypothetical protein